MAGDCGCPDHPKRIKLVSDGHEFGFLVFTAGNRCIDRQEGFLDRVTAVTTALVRHPGAQVQVES